MQKTVYILVLTFILAACSPQAVEDSLVVATSVVQDTTSETVAEEPTTEPVVVEPTNEPVIEEPTSETTVIEPTAVPVEPTTETVTSSYDAPEWTSLEIRNARTAQTFTLADFAGKTVFVEPMATWCSNCRRQQGTIAQAMAQLDPDSFVFISLSVGENIGFADLAAYANRNNFPQVFAVATPELTQALIDTFGFTVTSPPSTPHFTISPNGTVGSLSTGFHSVEEFVDEALTVQRS